MIARDLGRDGVSLSRLLQGIAAVSSDVAVADITLDSRSATRGGLFLACRGITSHGLEHLSRAVAAGVAAVAWEPAPGILEPRLPETIVAVRVPDLSRHVGMIADRFFGSPSAYVRIAGITGTNGKTTSAWLLVQALAALGQRAAYAGTLGYGTPAALKPATHTTPDAVSVHRMLSDMRATGIRALGMEVSSHALAQDRVAGVRFDTAAFTNLTRDHLDYHRSMEAYGEAKAQLFSVPGLRHRIINLSDPFGRSLAGRLLRDIPLTAVTTGGEPVEAGAARFVHLRNLVASAAGLDVDFDSSWGAGRLHSPLIGDFNGANLVTVLAILLTWDIPLERAIAALQSATAPAGRMETFGGGTHPLAVVDYAHSPDALEKALRALRRHCRGQLWCVFGCGGDRDAGKRPLMGAVAARLADEIIITDDNPRTEDPDRIVADIVAGLPASRAHRVIRERARAIATALTSASRDDIVLIAGKGHEHYQIYGTRSQPFSDAEQVRRALGVAP